MPVVIDLEVAHSMSILGTNTPELSRAFNCVIGGCTRVLVQNREIHLEDRILFEFRRIALHFDPKL